MPTLIILRGNSGSGKSTVARQLQRAFGRNTMVISQDTVRREMLWVKNHPNNESIELMIQLLRYGRAHSQVVILEGILYSEIYKPLFVAAIEEFGQNIFAYYYDLPFEETIARHNTKVIRYDFGEEDMRRWWRENDYIGFIKEKTLNKSMSIQDTVDLILSDVNEFRSKGNILKNDALTIGVDGCRNGWIAAVIDRGQWRVEKFAKIDDIVGKYKKFDEFIIDMPIGFPGNVSHIRPDSVARALIPGRTSTIFAVPSRQAVNAETKDEQISENQKALGKSLASQTMAIIPKIREVDTFLCENPEYKNVIKESHPEVCFARLNGRVVMSKKSKEDGLVERVGILQKYIPDLTVSGIKDIAREYRCNADDIVDAICLAVTGNLNVQGMAERIPAEPMKDDEGIIMQMVIPKNTNRGCSKKVLSK